MTKQQKTIIKKISASFNEFDLENIELEDAKTYQGDPCVIFSLCGVLHNKFDFCIIPVKHGYDLDFRWLSCAICSVHLRSLVEVICVLRMYLFVGEAIFAGNFK
ncbi:hypothetical protein [Dipodfec virus UOA04_Rod_751]|nr:hypothetical protein [Dipodfec virus UOA04_Rod_751]